MFSGGIGLLISTIFGDHEFAGSSRIRYAADRADIGGRGHSRSIAGMWPVFTHARRAACCSVNHEAGVTCSES
jgi:hypothetical protein